VERFGVALHKGVCVITKNVTILLLMIATDTAIFSGKRSSEKFDKITYVIDLSPEPF